MTVAAELGPGTEATAIREAMAKYGRAVTYGTGGVWVAVDSPWFDHVLLEVDDKAGTVKSSWSVSLRSHVLTAANLVPMNVVDADKILGTKSYRYGADEVLIFDPYATYETTGKITEKPLIQVCVMMTGPACKDLLVALANAHLTPP